MSDNRTSIPLGSLWMLVVSIGLFFVPAVNGLIGGLVGGYKVGTPGRGVTAAILPAAVAGAASWLLLTALEHTFLGLFAGLAASIIVLGASVAMLAGAIIGGLLAQRQNLPTARAL